MPEVGHSSPRGVSTPLRNSIRWRFPGGFRPKPRHVAAAAPLRNPHPRPSRLIKKLHRPDCVCRKAAPAQNDTCSSTCDPELSAAGNHIIPGGEGTTTQRCRSVQFAKPVGCSKYWLWVCAAPKNGGHPRGHPGGHAGASMVKNVKSTTWITASASPSLNWWSRPSTERVFGDRWRSTPRSIMWWLTWTTFSKGAFHTILGLGAYSHFTRNSSSQCIWSLLNSEGRGMNTS